MIHEQLTGIMLTFSKGLIRIASAEYLNIDWRSCRQDSVFLEEARSASIEKRLFLNQMRWACHGFKMGDGRLPKQFFYGKITKRKRPQKKNKQTV